MFDVRELNVAIELWGVAFCLVGMACSLLFSGAEGTYRRIVVSGFACELVACAGDALAGVFRGRPGTVAWWATHAGNLATFVGNFFLVAVLTAYLCDRLRGAGEPVPRRWNHCVGALCVTLCLAAAAGAFYHIDDANLYRRGDWYWVSLAFVMAVCLVNVLLTLRGRRGLGRLSFLCLMYYSVMPVLAASLQAAVYGLNFVIVAGVLNMVVVFFETRAYSARLMQRRTEQLARAQVELADSRIAVMVSQIQPHFLFNALDTIYGLVDEDAGLAKGAIASFSRYLRGNLDSLGRTTPVPIEAELEHVRTYLELERMADEDKIAYEIDARTGGFAVPALSVQTLAENAVKHGIAAAERGGCVRVRTRELPREYTVSVVDDGVGFEVASAPAGAGHVGIANTRERLAAMCGGTLEVLSRPGAGTTVVMHVPKAGRAS